MGIFSPFLFTISCVSYVRLQVQCLQQTAPSSYHLLPKENTDCITCTIFNTIQQHTTENEKHHRILNTINTTWYNCFHGFRINLCLHNTWQQSIHTVVNSTSQTLRSFSMSVKLFLVNASRYSVNRKDSNHPFNVVWTADDIINKHTYYATYAQPQTLNSPTAASTKWQINLSKILISVPTAWENSTTHCTLHTLHICIKLM